MEKLQKYDVIQVCRDGRWLDFSTLRTEEEFAQARRLVDQRGAGVFETAEFRVVRGCAEVVVYERLTTGPAIG